MMFYGKRINGVNYAISSKTGVMFPLPFFAETMERYGKTHRNAVLMGGRKSGK